MIEIIPAIDLIDGRCVRLSQGDYDRCTQYKALPEEMVKMYADAGVKRVHVVDLDGAKASAPRNLDVLERIASLGVATIEWGGGLKNDDALRDAFNAGADYAIAGSIAVKDPEVMEKWLLKYGGEKVILGADLRDGKVSVSGWLEDSALSIDDVIGRFLPAGLSQVICTDISKDGMLSGPDTELYTSLQERYPKLIFTVSGGISSMDDIIRLDDLGLPRVIVGKAIYENRISLLDIEHFILNH